MELQELQSEGEEDQEDERYVIIKYHDTKVEWKSVNVILERLQDLYRKNPKAFKQLLLYSMEILGGKLTSIENFGFFKNSHTMRYCLERYELSVYSSLIPLIAVSIGNKRYISDDDAFKKERLASPIKTFFDLYKNIKKTKFLDNPQIIFSGSRKKLRKKYIAVRHGNTKVEPSLAKIIWNRGEELHKEYPKVFYRFYLYLKALLAGERFMSIGRFHFFEYPFGGRPILELSKLSVYSDVLPVVIVSMVHYDSGESEKVLIGSPFVEDYLKRKKLLTNYQNISVDLNRKKKELKNRLIKEMKSEGKFSDEFIKRLGGKFQKSKKDQKNLNSFVSLCQSFHNVHYKPLQRKLKELGFICDGDDENYSVITQVHAAVRISSLIEVSKTDHRIKQLRDKKKKRKSRTRTKGKEKLQLTSSTEDEEYIS